MAIPPCVSIYCTAWRMAPTFQSRLKSSRNCRVLRLDCTARLWTNRKERSYAQHDMCSFVPCLIWNIVVSWSWYQFQNKILLPDMKQQPLLLCFANYNSCCHTILPTLNEYNTISNPKLTIMMALPSKPKLSLSRMKIYSEENWS